MSWNEKQSDGDNETSVRTLMTVLFTTKPGVHPLPGYAQSTRFTTSHDRMIMGVDCDEVYPNIFVGDMGAAKNKTYLKLLGVTHVLNTAEGRGFGMVDTCAEYYQDVGIKYLGLKMMDLPMTNISQYFEQSSYFIDSAVSNGGKVLVNCLMGMSRSSTCVLAYLMQKEGLPAAEALRMVRLRRDIRPNDGFLRQLAEFDNQLRLDRAAKL